MAALRLRRARQEAFGPEHAGLQPVLLVMVDAPDVDVDLRAFWQMIAAHLRTQRDASAAVVSTAHSTQSKSKVVMAAALARCQPACVGAGSRPEHRACDRPHMQQRRQ